MSNVATHDQLEEIFHAFDNIPQTVLPYAYNRATDGFTAADLSITEYAKNFSYLMSAAMRDYIKHNPYDGWQLDTHTDRLHLIHKATGMKVRMLKNICHGTGIPAAGSNFARRREWQQAPLGQSTDIFGLPVYSYQTFILAWQCLNNNFSAIICHPISTGNYHTGAYADLTIHLGKYGENSINSQFPDIHENRILIPSTNIIVNENPTIKKVHEQQNE